MCYVYVRKPDRSVGVLKAAEGTDYSSALAFWAYRQGMPAAEASRLFRREVFEELGYLDRWMSDVQTLKGKLERAGLDFGEFFLPLLRRTPFMHTMNHPATAVLVQLARVVGARLGAEASLLREPLERLMPDGLGEIEVWPVLPDIATALGMEGGLTWKVQGRYIHGIEPFITSAYAGYAAGNAHAPEFSCTASPEPTLFERVLRRAA
jgi:hypothetical protein